MFSWLQDRIFQMAGSVKALLAVLLTVALLAADYWDAIPLQPLLQQYLGDDVAGKLSLWLPILFGTLRYVSTNQVQRKDVELPASAVDEGF